MTVVSSCLLQAYYSYSGAAVHPPFSKTPTAADKKQLQKSGMAPTEVIGSISEENEYNPNAHLDG